MSNRTYELTTEERAKVITLLESYESGALDTYDHVQLLCKTILSVRGVNRKLIDLYAWTPMLEAKPEEGSKVLVYYADTQQVEPLDWSDLDAAFFDEDDCCDGVYWMLPPELPNA